MGLLKHQKLPHLKHLILAWPCSGTKYVSETLRANGYFCIHEGLDYIPEHGWCLNEINLVGGSPDKVEAVCSYDLAEKFAGIPPLDKAELIHMIRDPLRVFNSLHSLRIRGGNSDPEETLGKLRFIYDKISDLMCKRGGSFFKVEEAAEALPKIFSIPIKDVVSHDTNSHNKGLSDLKWRDLLGFPDGRWLAHIARVYGYF